MKHVAITFDDGRSDNYLLAKRIMDPYRFRGTVYVTTGFVDGTWEEQAVLKSPTEPLSPEQIRNLWDAGWEIGLHGDRHQMQAEDMLTALSKLRLWGIEQDVWGVSAPNSRGEEQEIAALLDGECGAQIAYIRRGRKCDTSKLENKVLYAGYSLLKSRWAYRCFNRENCFQPEAVDSSNIPSVVVKSGDRPEWIADYIRRLPEGSAVVLMLHSILPVQHPACGKDPWSWESGRFDRLCMELKEMTERGEAEVLPLMELVKGRDRNGENTKQGYRLEYR